MPQLDLSSISPNLVLLGMLLLLYVYFLPTLLAFQRGQRNFWAILGLNILVGILQPILLQRVLPVQTDALPPLELVWVSFLYSTGPGWIALVAWALRPVAAPNQRLLAFRETKLFDTLAALPLVVWFAFSAISLRGNLAHDAALVLSGQASLLICLQFLSLLFSILFCLLTVWLLLVRDKPVRRIAGALPRICAVCGTFLGVGMLSLPVAELSLPVQGLCFVLTGVGSAGSFLVLSKLGKSFSIVPEARRLVTNGPYGWARHPLYAAEIITVLGLIVQYRQPWALLIGASVIALQVTRSVFEERVLTEAFPEYAQYRARVKRFGIV